jgi:hypothetical protein
MGTKSSDPVFDSLRFPYDDRLSRRGAAKGAATSELVTIADAIEELQHRLAQARDQLAHTASDDTAEDEIARIVAEVQQFSEACLSRLEVQIRGILAEVEVKAAEILREADEEAAEILRRAQEATFTS